MLGLPQPKNYFTATVAPTSTDNLADGYEAGSEWIVPDTNDFYKCLYSDRTAARWFYVTGTVV